MKPPIGITRNEPLYVQSILAVTIRIPKRQTRPRIKSLLLKSTYNYSTKELRLAEVYSRIRAHEFYMITYIPSYSHRIITDYAAFEVAPLKKSSRALHIAPSEIFRDTSSL